MPRNLLIWSAGFRNLDPQTDDMEDRNMLANTIRSKIRSHEFLFLCWFSGYSFCLPVTTTTTIHQNLAPQISRHHHVKSKVSCVSACFCFVSDLRRHSYGSKRKANLKKWFKKNRKSMTQAIHSLVSASIDGVIDSAAQASIDGVIDSACGMTPSNHLSCVGVHRWDLELSAGWKYSKLHLSCIAMHSYLAVFACWFLLVCQWAETTMTILGQDVGIQQLQIKQFHIWIHSHEFMAQNSGLNSYMHSWSHIYELGIIRIQIHEFIIETLNSKHYPYNEFISLN